MHRINALNGLSIMNESANVMGNQIIICSHKSGLKIVSNINTPTATIMLVNNIVNHAAPSPILL